MSSSKAVVMLDQRRQKLVNTCGVIFAGPQYQI